MIFKKFFIFYFLYRYLIDKYNIFGEGSSNGNIVASRWQLAVIEYNENTGENINYRQLAKKWSNRLTVFNR